MATRIILQCQRCGQDFPVPPARATEAKYCSRACYFPPAPLVVCKVCGKEFRVGPKMAASRQYCSLKCKGQDCSAMGGYKAPAAERFLVKVSKVPGHGPNGDCWQWTGSLDEYGYGRFIVERKKTLAHRFSYQTYIGPVPDGAFVCHSCDNRACVRPEHLWLGDALSNTRDMVEKGRARHVTGRLGDRAILSEEDARAILADKRSRAVLAAEYGVTKDTISRLRTGRSWKYLHSSPLVD